MSTFTRASHWEFWPPWMLYPPVAAYVAWLAARHGGFSTIAAANPGLPDGGLVGESKFDILRRLPPDCTLAGALIPPGPVEDRVRAAAAFVAADGGGYPVILKPDVGQRGVGVRRAASRHDLRTYFREYPHAVVAQQYHPGPYEAGVFYWRLPSEAEGRIFSITDKAFPELVGDGRSTLASLVTGHPRFARQADTFLARHAPIANQVLAAGACFKLGDIGNHAQGALFRDGSHLITEALRRRIDAIARQVRGFYVGRFDVRYSDVEAFKAGRDLAIIELNGVSAESTNIYDPSRSVIDAWRTLFEQWQIIFAIGAENRRRGSRPATGRLWRLVWEHLTDRRTFPVSG
ncbi:MAG: carboxylate--amine ligase [Acidobacteriota bacterium]